jgi:hypothetical protein
MGGFTREKNTFWMPLFFFSVKGLFSPIILLPGLSPGELPNPCSWLLTSDLYFVKRPVHHFLAVQEKAVGVPYCVIFEYTSVQSIEGRLQHTHFCILKAFSIFRPESRTRQNSLYIKIINCIFSFLFFPMGAKHQGFESRNIDQAGSSVSITSKSWNKKGRNIKTQNVCGPGSERDATWRWDVTTLNHSPHIKEVFQANVREQPWITRPISKKSRPK